MASPASVLLVTGTDLLRMLHQQTHSAVCQAENLRHLGRSGLVDLRKLKATFTNWFSLLAFASQLLFGASLTLL